jgi:DNA-binding NtrC family response regulator
VPAKPRVLVIDDQLAYAEIVRSQMPEFTLTRPLGPTQPPRLPDGPSALKYLKKHAAKVDVILLDMHFDAPPERLLPLGEGFSERRTRRFQGVAILREIRRLYPRLPVLLMTSIEDLALVDAADELIDQSMTYLLDGGDVDALRIRISGALKEADLDMEESGILWGEDLAMRAIRRRLMVLTRGRMPVILEGETGTGKSYLAEKFLHANSGRPGPFITLDLSSVPSDLVAAHLFGAVRGAYTGAVADREGVFQLAHKGTLFIDEIQNAPQVVQRQLLLALQDGRFRPLGSKREMHVDVKVIAASNASLPEAVRDGRFRSDLYMRLSPSTRVVIPPLRDRPADIPFLLRRFAALSFNDPEVAALRDEVAAALGMPKNPPFELAVGRDGKKTGDALQIVLPKPAWKLLMRHHWPGNMREAAIVMRNIVSFTLVEAVDAARSGLPLHSPRLQADTGLVGELLAGSKSMPAPGQGQLDAVDLIPVRVQAAHSLSAVSSSVERQYFLALYRQTSGDFAQMADILMGDADKARAVRLRFNQLGLKIRELRKNA